MNLVKDMVNSRLKSVASALAGLILGYLIWMAILGAIILLTPVYYWWAIAAVATLVALTAATFVMARRHKGKPVAYAYWLAPLLPTIMSVYVVVLATT